MTTNPARVPDARSVSSWSGRVAIRPRSAGLPNIPNRLTIELTDGLKLVQEVEFPRGHAGNPMTDQEVEAKFRQAVELFGWDRVLFGSNWPVSTLVVGYRDWVELLLDAFSDATDDELDRLFYRNAARVWRTPIHTPGANRAE